MKRSIAVFIWTITAGIALISFDANTQMGSGMMGSGYGSGQGMMSGGTAWGTGAFRSNGERIYFTATSERGTTITYAGGPDRVVG